MSKIYVFGIGGTGARVLKSLTMLLATGVRCDCTVVPVLIDPDEANGDMTRTIEMMKAYQAIREKVDFNDDKIKNKFFRTDIQEETENFRLKLNGTRDVRFKDYIQLSTMSDENKALSNMLFSEDNLEADMEVGFKGNPNIGSVVLNQFSNSADFSAFATQFSDKDKIFIVSSIFGGTGASGFPLLLKTLRTSQDLPNYALIRDAPIGAVTVLPYFKVKENKESSIDSTTFVSKTKSALRYYDENISDNNSIDALYYVGDNVQKDYDNQEGGKDQCNNAHFVELISALAVIDFANNGKKNEKPDHKEFGIDKCSNGDCILFDNLCIGTKRQLIRPMSQFIFFSRYLEQIDSHLDAAWAKDNGVDDTFLQGDFYRNIIRIKNDYVQWLDEMANNHVSFSPFDYRQPNLGNTIKGLTPKKNIFSQEITYSYMDDLLAKHTKEAQGQWSVETQFLVLFYNATSKLLKDRFNITNK